MTKNYLNLDDAPIFIVLTVSSVKRINGKYFDTFRKE